MHKPIDDYYEALIRRRDEINEELDGYFDITLPEKSITFAPLPQDEQYNAIYTQMLEELINECCSLRDVMNYPNGEKILNDVHTSVEKRTSSKQTSQPNPVTGYPGGGWRVTGRIHNG